MHIKSFTCGLGLAAMLIAAASATAEGPREDRLTTPPTPLIQARQDLVISQMTLRRIERDLEKLREQSAADPLVLADYARYLRAVRGLTQRQRAVVREMEHLHGGGALPTLVTEWPKLEPTDFVPAPPVIDDEIALLEQELAVSLAAFDEYLLQEQLEATRRLEQIDAASSEEMTDLAQEAAAAVERLRDRGIEVDTDMPPASEKGESERAPCRDGKCGECAECAPSGEKAGPATDGEKDGDDGPEGESGGMTGGGASGTGPGVEPPPGGAAGSDGEGGTTIPPVRDRPPAPDDDIVARQLREAAERETDPVLREKLWQEYERYKGIR